VGGWVGGGGDNPSLVHNTKVRNGCLQVTSYVTIYILHFLSLRHTFFSHRSTYKLSPTRTCTRNFHTTKKCTSVVCLPCGINVWNMMIGNPNTDIWLYISATVTHVGFVKVYSWWRPFQASKHVQNEFFLINTHTELSCDWWIHCTSLIWLSPTVRIHSWRQLLKFVTRPKTFRHFSFLSRWEKRI
jgi:hypothetical protein